MRASGARTVVFPTVVSMARLAAQRRAFGFDPHTPHLAETKWERALEEFSATNTAPTRQALATLTRDVLNRHVRSSVMGFAPLRPEFHVPLKVVLGLSQLAVDVTRAEYIAASLEAARTNQPVVTHPEAKDDSLHQLFDACMRHVSTTSIRRARGSEFFGGGAATVPGPHRPSPDDSAVGKETAVSVWEAAVSVMSHAHFCGVLQHEYDSYPDDNRINATSRVWRNFTIVMSSEAAGTGCGRSSWENALSLLAYLTPIPRANEPPCCGFTASDDELNVTRAVEECLGRHDRRDELLRWWKCVRNPDPLVNRHICTSAEVGEYAKAVAEKRQGSETRKPWGIEQEVRGNTCITNLLRLIAPNAAPPASGETMRLRSGAIVTASVKGSGAFVDPSSLHSAAQVQAQDEALTRVATSTTAGSTTP